MATKGIPTQQIRRHMAAFEKALEKSETAEGRVDMPKLRQEVKKASRSKALAEVLDRSLDVIESRFSRTTSSGCGGSVSNPPASLSPKEVKSVFAAMIEAKSKGLDRLDKNRDGKISQTEAELAGGHKLSARLAAAAVIGEHDAKASHSSSGSSSSSTVSAGCGDAVSSGSSHVSSGCGGSVSTVSAGC